MVISKRQAVLMLDFFRVFAREKLDKSSISFLRGHFFRVTGKYFNGDLVNLNDVSCACTVGAIALETAKVSSDVKFFALPLNLNNTVISLLIEDRQQTDYALQADSYLVHTITKLFYERFPLAATWELSIVKRFYIQLIQLIMPASDRNFASHKDLHPFLLEMRQALVEKNHLPFAVVKDLEQ